MVYSLILCNLVAKAEAKWLLPGQVVIMDDLSSHKVAGVRERIESAGASLLYLPPYSPDLNPIEKSMGQTQTTASCRQGKNSRRTRPGHR
jgi:hypothetical protein